jgi:arsenate reductase (glutaredoxin)
MQIKNCLLEKILRVDTDTGKQTGDAAMKATIWHNPECGTSRKTLEILQAEPGLTLTIVEYKKTPYVCEKLEQLFADAGRTPAQALRVRGTNAEELGLTSDSATATQILNAMVVDAMLVERPFVKTEKGVRLCRPQEVVYEIL